MCSIYESNLSEIKSHFSFFYISFLVSFEEWKQNKSAVGTLFFVLFVIRLDNGTKMRERRFWTKKKMQQVILNVFQWNNCKRFYFTSKLHFSNCLVSFQIWKWEQWNAIKLNRSSVEIWYKFFAKIHFELPFSTNECNTDEKKKNGKRLWKCYKFFVVVLLSVCLFVKIPAAFQTEVMQLFYLLMHVIWVDVCFV